MKITRVLHITEQEFYDYLEEELLSDIYQCTKTKRAKKDIGKGMKYSKYTQDANARVDITIQDYKRGILYETGIKTLSDHIRICYRTQVTPEGLQVIFTESVESYETQKHSRLGKIFFEWTYLRQMSETLYDIETKIIKKREGIPVRRNQPAPEYPFLAKLLQKKNV